MNEGAASPLEGADRVLPPPLAEEGRGGGPRLRSRPPSPPPGPLLPGPLLPGAPFWLLAALCLVAPLTACGGGSYPVTRTIRGQPRAGHYISPHTYEHFIRGELAFARGDYLGAAEGFRQARAGSSDDPLLSARLAEAWALAGRPGDAARVLAEAERRDPQAEIVWLTRGRIAEHAERPNEAMASYRQAIEVAPRSERGPLALARLLANTGRAGDAERVLERYLARGEGPGAARARLALVVESGDVTQIARAVRTLLERAPARGEEIAAAAEALLEGGRPELAHRLFQALPEGLVPRAARLRAALEASDRPSAEGLLATWMPSDPREMVVVARGHLALGAAGRAREIAEAALAAEAGPAASLVLAEALFEEGRLGEAATTLASIPPESSVADGARAALISVLRAAGRPALAAPFAEDPLTRATIRVEAGDPEGALEALEGERPELRLARARLLDRAGRADEAAPLYAALAGELEGLPDAAASRARAEAALGAGDLPGAIAALAPSDEAAPESLLDRLRLAELEVRAGRADSARRRAERLLPLLHESQLRARARALMR